MKVSSIGTENINRCFTHHMISFNICLVLFLEIAKANEEKFKKMKDIYTKLREEHVTLIRSVSILCHITAACFTQDRH